ncbi:MAG: anti-sigma factor family protein [Rhodoferax sp.]
MDSTKPPALSDDELHALVDQQIGAAQRESILARLAQDPQAQARVDQWQQQRAMLQALHRPVLEQPIPSPLLAAAQQATMAHHAARQWQRLGGIAASLLLAFACGWLANGIWQPDQARYARAPAASDFIRQASYAYAVYSPEVRHPVEVAAAEQAHLVQWLSKRVGKPLKVPNLTAQGFELVGGRLLPGASGARAQFMFQNSAAQRVTLYLGATSDTLPQGSQTAFSFDTEGTVSSFYWVDQGLGYALSGQLPRQTLMQLAQAVYQQL